MEQEVAIAMVDFSIDNPDYLTRREREKYDTLIHDRRTFERSCELSIHYLLGETEIVYAPVSLIKAIEKIIIRRKLEALLSPVDWIRNWAGNLKDFSTLE